MKGNEELQERIQKALDSYPFPNHPSHLYEPIRYILSLGAKRMRPQLLLMGCELFDGNLDLAVQPALGIEFFHNFTLMHDDIMDNAPLRRANQPFMKNGIPPSPSFPVMPCLRNPCSWSCRWKKKL